LEFRKAVLLPGRFRADNVMAVREPLVSELAKQGASMSQPDEDLLARAVAGDKEALVELLNRHSQEVRRALGTLPESWRSVVTADDIMQDMYITVFEKINDFKSRDVGSFVGWMTTLAKNGLVDVIRALKAAKRGGDRVRLAPESEGDIHLNLLQSLGGTTTTPTQAARREEAKAAVHRALERLDDAYRQVVVLYDLECRTSSEVAQTLGCTEGAMFMRRYRAHEKLRRSLGSLSNFE
jgi:RNA polymerase sigma-70 factor (ECF subfamily)